MISEIDRRRPIIEKSKKNPHKISLKHQELHDFLKHYKDAGDEILLSIIIPVYNEEKTIRNIILNLPKDDSIEIIVIDDHSTDDSIREIGKIPNSHNLKLIKHKNNKGYGGAIITGMKYARGKVIVTMDSDGQHSPDDILRLIKPIFEDHVDNSIGSRYLGTCYYKLPLSTRFGEVLIEKLVHIWFGIKIVNNQNGFRAYDRKMLHIFDNIRFLGYAFCTEQIVKAKLNGYRIKEYPIKVYNREHGSSKIVLWKLALDIFSCLLIYWYKKIRYQIFRKNANLNSVFF
ncbi:MAG: glycosyltransferase family 2 protein [Promethearchaeota archaeon]|nr:MAG: glycosyltransferase family 2 protein [Candidatus Lokiarchaeota archaeon]